MQFLDKPNGAASNGSGQPANGSAGPVGSTEAPADFDDDIPF